jgi:HTH-type transcriptional regulator / antitoxin HigA
MDIHPLHTDADYQAALARIAPLVEQDPPRGTPEGDYLDVLSALIEHYEARHFPLERPTPVEAIRFRMEQAGLSVADMRPYIGPPNRVYEVLNGKRPLSISMIRRLHEGLQIPASALIGAA